jgi:dipeptidyl aminopeptidase/acylaminoacyl peptidase
MSGVLASLCSLALVTVASTAAVRAQDAQSRLPIEVLLTAPRLAPAGGPSLTPDGRLVAYTVIEHQRGAAIDRPGVPWYAVGGDIWVSSVRGGPARRITVGRGSNWAPSWSPDGRRLAFLSDWPNAAPAARIHVWTWDRASGQLRQVKKVRVLDPWARPGRLEWLGDSRSVVVKVYPEGAGRAAYESTLTNGADPSPVGADVGTTVQVFHHDPVERDQAPSPGANNLDALLGDLALLDVETGAVRRLARSVRLCTYALSPDRRMLAWAVATRFERPESYQVLVDLFVHDLTTGESRRLVTGAPLIFAYPSAAVFSWSPNSRAIAYRTDGPAGTKDEVYVVPVVGGPGRRIAEGPARDPSYRYDERPLWAVDGRRVFFVRAGALWQVPVDGTDRAGLAAAANRSLRMIEQGSGTLWSPDGVGNTIVVTGDPATKRMGLARVDLRAGAVTQLLEEDKWYDTTLGNPPVVTADGKSVVYVASESRRPPDLWLAGVDSPIRPRRISEIAPELGGFSGGLAKVIEWRGLDGDTLRGALIRPAGYRPGTRYPLIVQVYGGTSVSDELNRFGSAIDPVDNVQVLASRGYAVLLADSKIRVGTPALELLKTVLPGVDRAIELGVADPGRLGLMGHSYGGYSTLSLTVQSRRFRAAVMRAGFGNLLGIYGQLSSDGTNHNLPWAEQGQGSMGGTPWEVRERYLENSPMMYLDRVETPLLIIHGAEDQTVRSFLADEIFVALRRLGKRVDYARYAGEHHWEAGWSLPNQVDYLTRVIAWFDRYVKHADVSSGATGTQ